MTIEISSSVAAPATRSRSSNLVLALGFSLTGAGTVMLGVLLPALSQKFALRDAGAGLLFFAQFLGSSLGAILTGRNRLGAIRIGYGLLVASACALVFVGLHLLYPVFFVFGLGLGMAMTGTSLIVSDRSGEERAAALERLNFAWAAGAAVAPLLLVPFLRLPSLRPLFLSLQVLFLLMLGWAFFGETTGSRFSPSRSPIQTSSQTHTALRSLLPLLALALCSVGIESSLSGWLTTYSHRAALQDTGRAALATSIFWLGVMLSRLAFSTRLLRLLGRNLLLRVAVVGLAASIPLLIAAREPVWIRIAAGLAAVCLGPLYPLVLSFLLERTPSGWVLAVAGMGSAIFPWMTGVVSSHYGSLREGLLVPAGVAIFMIGLLAARPERDARSAA